MDFTTVIVYLKDLIVTILTLLMMISPAFGGNGVSYSAEKPDELITGFAVVSDIHVETNNPASYENLKNVLYGIKAGEDVDTVLYTGDNVMNGQVLEDFFFYSAIRAVMPAENNFVLAGNHDYGNGAEGTDSAKLRQKYLYNNLLLGNVLSNDYYYRVVDGVYMVCLVSERPDTTDFAMTKDQYDWLEGVLKEAKEAGAPIFVFNHYPLYYLDNDSEIHKNDLAGLLNEYGVELFIHGHIHDDIGPDNFYNWGGVDCINLCRVTETVDYEPGDGIVVEVYDGEVVVRVRDFIKGEWVDGLRYTY